MLVLSPIEEGILKVGIGKYGSEPIPDDLADLIINDLENPKIPSIQKGALIGALFLKGFESNGEKKIQNYFKIYHPDDIIQVFCKFTKENFPTLISLIKKLLQQQTLNLEESFIIGNYLFNPDIPENYEFEIGLITTILRFRYETIQEYVGLLNSIENKFNESWTKLPETIANKTIIITEPFDGVERSFLYTPLIGNLLSKHNFIPIYIVSDNPGPKFHYNLKDLSILLGGVFIKSTEELIQRIQKNELNAYGFFIDINDLNPILNRWVQRRKLLKKRPFLATIERIFNPIKANIQIFSAFHPPYLEKTTEILQNKEIPIIYGLRRGEEGGLTFSFNKRNETLLAKKEHSYYTHQKDTFFYSTISKFNYTPDIQDNIKIIKHYQFNNNINSLDLNLYKNFESQIEELNQYLSLQIEKTLHIYQNFIHKILS